MFYGQIARVSVILIIYLLLIKDTFYHNLDIDRDADFERGLAGNAWEIIMFLKSNNKKVYSYNGPAFATFKSDSVTYN
jgi:hypothetical protein